MKVYYDVGQGSADWFKLRMGIPTASCFDKIITPKTGQLSKSSRGYAFQLLSERLLKAPTETMEGQMWMDRGKELEPTAVRQYEFVNEVETVAVGFITNDEGTIGASPDRLVTGKPIAVEIKCPSAPVLLRYLFDGQADDYRPQVQGQLYVGDLEFVDFYGYHPRMPPCQLRTPRDEPYIKMLAAALKGFNEQLLELFEQADKLGAFQAFEQAVTPVDVEHAEELRSEIRDGLELHP